METQETIIRITPNNNTILVEDVENGVHRSKRVSLQSLTDSIKNSLERSYVSSGLLPPGCLAFQMGVKGQFITTILHPDRRADITYGGTEYKNFPLPRLVFKFMHQDGARVMRCWMGVVGEGVPTPKTPMYWYPFSNVSGGYHLCTGSNPLPKCKSLHTLGSLPYYILAMPNNNDHFSKNCNKPKLEMRDLMELLKDKDPDYYYSDILIPDKKTVMDFINIE